MNQGQFLHQAIIANLQRDEITRMMHSLIQDTANLGNYNGFICPHTVLLFEQQLQYNHGGCNQCFQASNSPNRNMKSYQLSGILYFLLGGQENDQNAFAFYQTVDQYYFLEFFQLNMNFNRFQAECLIIDYQTFEARNQFYQELHNQQYIENCPSVAIYQLTRYCVIIDRSYCPIFAGLTDPLIDLFESYKQLMKFQIQVEDLTNFRFPLPCIHSLYIKRRGLDSSIFYLSYNVFYSDNLCTCDKTHGRALFYLLTHQTNFMANYSANNIVQNHFLDFAVSEADIVQPRLFLRRMIEFQQNVRVFQSFIMGGPFPISFYANDLFRQIRGLTGNQLCCAYKIVFQQQTIELMELLIVRLRQLHPQFDDPTIYNNIIYLKKRRQVARINQYQQIFQEDQIFVNLHDTYNEQIQDVVIAEGIEDIAQNPVFNENGIQNALYTFRIFVSQDLDVRLNFDAPNNVIRQQLNIEQITYNDLVRFERQITQNPPNI